MSPQSDRPRVFSPQPIKFYDDARHRTGYFSHVETWYYDAVFENGYSIVSLVNVIHLGRIGTVLSGIFIYKDGVLLKHIRKRYPLRSFHGSEETLHIILQGKEIIKGSVTTENNWIYQINRGDQENGFQLKFSKTMEPFKGKTFLGSWLVIPGFSVTGTLTVEGKKMTVKGSGYHDHNIYPLRAPFVTRGYFFGKIPLDNAKVIWAQVQKNKHTAETLVILAENKKFTSIHPDNIQFTVEEQRKDHRKMMPYTNHLKTTDHQLTLDVRFAPESYHHIGILGAHYWRYHVKYKGTYTRENNSSTISDTDVAEYLHFF